jgi:hypothetical protein
MHLGDKKLVKLSPIIASIIMILTTVTLIVGIGLFLTLVRSDLTQSGFDLLNSFEEENFMDKEIISVDSINSGDVRIKQSLTKFIEISENKSIYRSGEKNSKCRTYHVFEEKSDGELVEYYYSIQFNLNLIEQKVWLEERD